MPVKTDCRIIVATHRNLLDEVKKGRFREDLYYRILGLPVELPPLRERDKDVLILAKYFAERFCSENDLPLKQFADDAQKKLLSHRWPGNIRELKSVVELAAVLSNADIIDGDSIKLTAGDVLPELMQQEITMREYNFKILDVYLKKYNNDISLVAQKLDISQATIYRMLKEMRTATGNA
jgi:DNA-binding NtrC family response regulator